MRGVKTESRRMSSAMRHGTLGEVLGVVSSNVRLYHVSGRRRLSSRLGTAAVAGVLGVTAGSVAHAQPEAAGLLVSTSVVALQNAPDSPAAPASLTVLYDRKTDMISIRSHQTPLLIVLEEVSRQAAFQIALPKRGLDEPLSVAISPAPLDQALKQLLREFNATFVYEPRGAAPEGPAASRLVRVVILSRKTIRSDSDAQHPEATRQAVSPAEVRPIELESIRRDPTANSWQADRNALWALKDPTRAHERQSLVAALLDRLTNADSPPDDGVLAALFELAPDLTIKTLAGMLGAADTRKRTLAAAALGRLRDQRAVEALASALNDEERVRQAAASSLALIGGEGRNVLLRAYLAGNDRIKYAIAVAIASHGDRATREGFARLVLRAPIPPVPAPDTARANPNAR